ncbi:TlpA disulfide reductase family protein [Flavivirga aquimarina]|uniref:TlpA disulfide reductase family protein n=1 Tax=Flavivirga aquimarina TaxID=2027862 RepID=A0ABT8W7U1_9FLAO|nr:TlpA disulfide reductase family protein [Flavivirga aquimarina]MDO5969127.1 TlpA disulfide reductase family protein [Flavivirga aquimarina]
MLTAIFYKRQKKLFLCLILIISFCVSCKNEKTDVLTKNVSKISNDIPIYNFNTLEPLLYTKTNKTYIINFWAMWCAPCVKELPYIQQYANKNPDAEIILISLDFPEDIETKLKPFLKEKNITSKVILLDDPDSNTWIDKIDPNWSGAIPFTIIFNNKKRGFFEHTFSSLEDLENTITKTLNL